MAKYDFYFTKEDAQKAYAKIKDLEAKLGLSLDWKRVKNQSGDSIAYLINYLERELSERENKAVIERSKI